MKFRLFKNNGFDGPYTVAELFNVPDFSLKTPVLPEGSEEWTPAEQFPAITQYKNPPIHEVASGDYQAETVIPEKSSPLSAKSWRDGVIGADLPAIKSYPAPGRPYKRD
jgi:hypothetical protein